MPAAQDRSAAPRASLGYLFVVTYGRSGSTLLSGVLNSIPGYLVRGENGDALRHLYHFHDTLLTEKRRRSGTRAATHPFFGINGVPEDRLVAGSRRLALETVLRPRPLTRVVGFKEIRWWAADLDGYVAWLRLVFPGARFVVNTREHSSVLRSGWYRDGDPERRASELASYEARLLALAERLGDEAYRTHYDDVVADPTVLRGLFEWLDEPWDEARVRAVLDVPHSVTPPSRSGGLAG